MQVHIDPPPPGFPNTGVHVLPLGSLGCLHQQNC